MKRWRMPRKDRPVSDEAAVRDRPTSYLIEAVGELDLYELVITMRYRCEAVIAVGGIYTIW